MQIIVPSFIWPLNGLLAILLGILSVIWTPQYFFLEERLRMRPGLPSYDWWYNPPDSVKMSLFLFNITNSERYLSGENEKLIVEKVGPVIFNCIFNYSNVVFNDNGTMSYNVDRLYVLNKDLTAIDLNATLMYPNLGVLLSASFFWDTNYFMKMMMNYAFEKTKSKPITKKTIYEILYNNTDPFLKLANSFMPHMAVTDNVGYVPLVLNTYNTRFTVNIGTNAGSKKYFLVNNINGSTNLPYRGDKCKDNIVNGSDSILTQLLERDTILRMYTPQTCSTLNFVYREDVYEQGVNCYKFVLPKDVFDRTEPLEDDCYKGVPALPDGLVDVSPCWYSFPVTASLTNYTSKDVIVRNLVFGEEENLSYMIAEPQSGVVLRLKIAMQASLTMKRLNGFHQMFDQFNDMTIPLLTSTVFYDELPDYMLTMVRLVTWLPTIGHFLSSSFLFLGVFCLWKMKKRSMKTKNRCNGIRRLQGSNFPEIESFMPRYNLKT